MWDKEDYLSLEVHPGISAGDSSEVRRHEGRPGARVPLATIDKLVAELELGRVDVIKMDHQILLGTGWWRCAPKGCGRKDSRK